MKKYTVEALTERERALLEIKGSIRAKDSTKDFIERWKRDEFQLFFLFVLLCGAVMFCLLLLGIAYAFQFICEMSSLMIQ